MSLPEALLEAIAQELAECSQASLATASQELSARYRSINNSGSQRYMALPSHHQAYLATRLPATFAAVFRVLQELQHRLPDCAPNSLLDLGAGPGTTMWAAAESFDTLSNVTAFEQDPGLIAIGKRLAGHAERIALRGATWYKSDLRTAQELPIHDLVVASYILGELSGQTQENLIDLAWKATSQALVIIEPGTMDGFGRIRAMREFLLAKGGHLIAPCPHAMKCPIAAQDWCHFATRLPRTSQHRTAKGGTLSYEDEKFAYIVVARKPIALSYETRIVRHPQFHSGHVSFTLCTAEGIKQQTVSRRQGDDYKQARKLEWGDVL